MAFGARSGRRMLERGRPAGRNVLLADILGASTCCGVASVATRCGSARNGWTWGCRAALKETDSSENRRRGAGARSTRLTRPALLEQIPQHAPQHVCGAATRARHRAPQALAARRAFAPGGR